jgi:hypothetical protein
MSLLRLEAIDREDDLIDRFLVPPQGLGVFLTRAEYVLVTTDVSSDPLVGELDSVRVEEIVSDLGNPPMSRETSVPNPTKDIPADRPMRWGDGQFNLGTLGLAVSGTARIGAMVQLADQLHRAFEGMDVTISVIADVHHVTTVWAVAIVDVEFPQREIGIRRPMVRHRADLRALMRSLVR